MASQRLASTPQHIFKFAANAASHPIPRLRHTFASSTRIRHSAKRKLVTTTYYRPEPIDHLPQQPPRNTNVPETSIAGGSPIPHHFDPPPPPTAQEQPEHAPTNPSPAEKPNLAERETEAQKSKAVDAPATQQAAESTSAKPRKKLRPRKAAMQLTPSAISQLQSLLDAPTPKLIRVGVKNRGCSGLAYHLEYVDKAGTFDETVEQEGVKVLIDSKALFSIIGSEMDWVEDKLSARFVFRNPNISESNSMDKWAGIGTYTIQRSNADVENHSWFEHIQVSKMSYRGATSERSKFAITSIIYIHIASPLHCKSPYRYCVLNTVQVGNRRC